MKAMHVKTVVMQLQWAKKSWSKTCRPKSKSLPPLAETYSSWLSLLWYMFGRFDVWWVIPFYTFKTLSKKMTGDNTKSNMLSVSVWGCLYTWYYGCLVYHIYKHKDWKRNMRPKYWVLERLRSAIYRYLSVILEVCSCHRLIRTDRPLFRECQSWDIPSVLFLVTFYYVYAFLLNYCTIELDLYSIVLKSRIRLVYCSFEY